MTRGVDDRTQVQAVTLRTEAELLKTWMARREAEAQRRREGPLEALRHRQQLLEREVPRLELEVASLERHQAKPLPGVGAAFTKGVTRGLILMAAVVAWVVGVIALKPDARVDDPVRVAAVVAAVVLVVVARVSQEARS
jgi:hypothetical protein